MLYTKKIEEINYNDVVGFCNEQISENISLDYKEEIKDSLVKTVAAMANTWGGLIIIGVKDQDSKPQLPVIGLPYKEHIREQINNLILGNITPPLFPEIQVCQSDDHTMAFVVIRIAQSNITPHAIKGNTKVYIRTETSNEPESLVTIDRLAWLTDRREKSIILKDSFYKTADYRLYELAWRRRVVQPGMSLLAKNWVPISRGDFIIASSPLFPFEALIDYRKLDIGLLNTISVDEYHGSFPLNLNYTTLESVQSGIYSITQGRGEYICYEEFNQHGFIYHRECVARTDKDDKENNVTKVYLISILIRLNCFLKSIVKFYEAIGYWGFIEIKFSLDKINDVEIIDLPAPRGKHKLDETTKTPLDNLIMLKRELKIIDLKDRHDEILIDIILELSWAVGFKSISHTYIKELLEKGW